MRFFIGQLRKNFSAYICTAVAALCFATVFILYSLPVGAVAYATVLALFFMLIISIIGAVMDY